MRIPCPCCGLRSADEFSFLGDAAPVRPAEPDVAAFAAYVYMRDNPAGVLREYWYHSAGCRAWIIVARNTVTHDILGAELARA